VQALCWVVWTAQQCGWDQYKHCAGWCGLHNGVVAYGGELGSLGAASAGVPRQGTGRHEVGFIAITVMAGAECTTVWLLRGVDGAGCLGEAAMGVP
jgi:hypothetical protein